MNKEDLKQYAQTGEVPDYNDDEFKKFVEETLKNRGRVSGALICSESNIKGQNDKEVTYQPKPTRVSKKALRLRLIKIILSITAGLIFTGGGIYAGVQKVDNYHYAEAESRISTVFSGYRDGMNSAKGDIWFEAGKFVDSIMVKKSYDNPEELYYQLARIYTGLNDYTGGKEKKLNDEKEDGYTPKEWIDKIYVELNQRLKDEGQIGLGPDKFYDWLKETGKLPTDPEKDIYEDMQEKYLEYANTIKEKNANKEEKIVLLPVEEALGEQITR